MKPNQNRIDSIRDRIGSGRPGSTGQAQRRSRRDQEAQYQRMFMLTMIGVVSLVVLILGGGAIYEYAIKPNAVLAEVNGHEIRRRDYWKYQSVALYSQARQYESFAMQSQGEQQQQFLQFAASFDAQRDDVWGSTEVSSTTLQQMVDDRLFLDGAESLGVTVTDEQAQLYALNQFAPFDAPLVTPQPSPTMIPERARAATETANAQATQQSIALGTMVASPAASPIAGTPRATPVVNNATPQATPVVEIATPVATPVVDVEGSPVASSAATPNLEDSLRAAEAEYDIFQNDVFEDANMSEDDYLRLWVRPQLVREQVVHQLSSDVPQTDEQVNAQHILVGTGDLANQLYSQATGGADFGALARSNSTDTTTAATGGQLGWFTRLEVDPALAETAFALESGQISEPIETDYGWQIVRVIEKETDRPLSEAQYQLATTDAVDSWLETQRAESDISSDHLTTPTVTPAAFAPPAGAPTPIPATPIPVTPTAVPPLVGPQPVVPGSPAASPVASPIVTGLATPVASPVATPVASPVASPVATPAASPVASPGATATPAP
ncbi:MAG: peptidylprolyl isomerase [Chloroflexia bacterium]|nr:peptidylprolyl isomerase [Chloroflexia bacterium]